MTFTAPAALIGLLLLPAIVLMHLRRARHRQQVVSSIWLWEDIPVQAKHRLVRQLPLHNLLLPLQLLAALVLALLLAGPTWNTSIALHRIVVLDGSLPMVATDVQPSRWSEALHQVQLLLDRRAATETISVILAGPEARLLGTAPTDAGLARAISTLPPPSGTADLAGAAALVQGLAAAIPSGAVRVLFLASAQTGALSVPGLPLRTMRVGGALDNQSISTLAVRCLPSDACQAFARVRSTANVPRTVSIAVWADRTSLGQEMLRIPPRGSLDLVFAVPPGTRVMRATLLGHDALAADNTAWALVPVPWPRRVLLVSDSPGQLLPALNAIPGVQVQVVPTASYEDAQAIGKELVVMDGMAPEFLPPNPVMLVHPPADSPLLQTLKPSVFLPITYVDPQDPVTAGLDLSQLVLTGSSLAIPAWAREIAGGPNGPVILDGVLQGERVAVLPWDAGHSPAAQDPIFPLLIARLVRWLTPAVPSVLPQDAVVSLPANVLSVRAPSGAVLPGPVIMPHDAGVYRVAQTLGPEVSGDPLFVIPAATDTPVPTPASGAAWKLPALFGTLPQGLWPATVVGALLALGAEWWIYTRRT
jgi:hypothetical protein